jgi:hypothetical protein
MKVGQLQIICLSILLGCSARLHAPMTRQQAIEVARLYVQQTYPTFDVSRTPPTADYIEDHTGAYWVVGFRYPSPEAGVSHGQWTSLNVEVLTNGTVKSAIGYRT